MEKINNSQSVSSLIDRQAWLDIDLNGADNINNFNWSQGFSLNFSNSANSLSKLSDHFSGNRS